MAKGPHVILAKNVQIGVNKPKLLFILETSKTHTRGDKPQIVKIEKIKKKTNKQRDNNLKATTQRSTALSNYYKTIWISGL